MSESANDVIEVFNVAADENRLSPLRKQQVVALPAEGELWVAGDIHDNRTNFNKLLQHSHLDKHPERHLLLQELIHGDHYDLNGAEGSWKTLFRAAELKCNFSNQVHFLLANHDLAQIQGEGIMKAGTSVCEAFTAGVKRDFADRADAVNIAIGEFLLSLPLAVHAPNGMFFCHSLPTDSQIENFDFTVFDRALTGQDYMRRTGAVYQLIWGRNMQPETAEEFANKVNATILVTGHQPQDNGYYVNGERHLIIASEHSHGVFLTLKLDQTYDMTGLLRKMKKFVSLDGNK